VRTLDLASPRNLWQGRGSVATNIPPVQFLLVRTLGIIQMPPPEFQFSAQSVEIKIGKRTVRAVEIAHGTLQNRARPHVVASGLVMKSDRQLNHTLEMPTRGSVAGQRAPDIFENFVSVEEVGAVEERHAVPKRVSLHALVSRPNEPSRRSKPWVQLNRCHRCL